MDSNGPRTLSDAVVYFSNPDNCLNYLVARRWPNGVVCPTCGSKEVGFVASRRVWQCKTRHPKAQFSVKLGTIFEDSPLGLDKWLPAMWMIASNRNGISSWEIHRAIGVTQKTAWFMLHRIRLAHAGRRRGGKIGGEVEVDETFIGGKARNMHKARKLRALEGNGAGPWARCAFKGCCNAAARSELPSSRNRETHHFGPNIREERRTGIDRLHR